MEPKPSKCAPEEGTENSPKNSSQNVEKLGCQRSPKIDQNGQKIAPKGVSKSGSVSRAALGWPRGAQGTILDNVLMIFGRILV